MTDAPSMRKLFRMWWPLAASWLLMSFEGPAIALVLARLAHPEISLAAYGGLILPLCFLIEAPVVMLLSASTALSRDSQSYRVMRRFMHGLSAGLTLLHAVVAFTPVYYLVARGLIGAPEEIIEPSRIGMMLTLPWTWAIAYRRFNQGVLIRSGLSLAVGTGTMVRLSTELAVLGTAWIVGTIPGAAVAAATLCLGVVAEAFYAKFRVGPVRKELPIPPPGTPPLTQRGLLSFYIPLSLTSVLLFAANPLVSAAVSRMPEAISSLAVWPVVNSVSFIVRSFGVGFSEVVIAVIERPGAVRQLRRFGIVISAVSFAVFAVLAMPPLATPIYGTVVGLKPELVSLLAKYPWLLAPLPLLAVAQSYCQGAILHGRRTRSVTEAVFVFLFATSAMLVAGVLWGGVVGLPVGMAALVLGETLRTGWLWLRSRAIRRELWSSSQPTTLGSDASYPVL
ncbi:MAG: hypothetical protein GX536_00205 [Actinobacteria bacterium]|nr:hypothetical protein [Actinomycetota bacterium]